MEKREGGADKEMASEERGQEGGGEMATETRAHFFAASLPPFYGFIK